MRELLKPWMQMFWLFHYPPEVFNQAEKAKFVDQFQEDAEIREEYAEECAGMRSENTWEKHSEWSRKAWFEAEAFANRYDEGVFEHYVQKARKMRVRHIEKLMERRVKELNAQSDGTENNGDTTESDNDATEDNNDGTEDDDDATEDKDDSTDDSDDSSDNNDGPTISHAEPSGAIVKIQPDRTDDNDSSSDKTEAEPVIDAEPSGDVVEPQPNNIWPLNHADSNDNIVGPGPARTKDSDPWPFISHAEALLFDLEVAADIRQAEYWHPAARVITSPLCLDPTVTLLHDGEEARSAGQANDATVQGTYTEFWKKINDPNYKSVIEDSDFSGSGLIADADVGEDADVNNENEHAGDSGEIEDSADEADEDQNASNSEESGSDDDADNGEIVEESDEQDVSQSNEEEDEGSFDEPDDEDDGDYREEAAEPVNTFNQRKRRADSLDSEAEKVLHSKKKVRRDDQRSLKVAEPVTTSNPRKRHADASAPQAEEVLHTKKKARQDDQRTHTTTDDNAAVERTQQPAAPQLQQTITDAVPRIPQLATAPPVQNTDLSTHGRSRPATTTTGLSYPAPTTRSQQIAANAAANRPLHPASTGYSQVSNATEITNTGLETDDKPKRTTAWDPEPAQFTCDSLIYIRDNYPAEFKTEKRWTLISEYLESVYGVKRTWSSIKNYWNRDGRRIFGIDERNNPAGRAITTGAQSKLERKERRVELKKLKEEGGEDIYKQKRAQQKKDARAALKAAAASNAVPATAPVAQVPSSTNVTQGQTASNAQHAISTASTGAFQDMFPEIDNNVPYPSARAQSNNFATANETRQNVADGNQYIPTYGQHYADAQQALDPITWHHRYNTQPGENVPQEQNTGYLRRYTHDHNGRPIVPPPPRMNQSYQVPAYVPAHQRAHGQYQPLLPGQLDPYHPPASAMPWDRHSEKWRK